MAAVFYNPTALAFIYLIGCAAILGTIYYFVRNGLLFRCLGAMILAMGIEGYLGAVLGRNGINTLTIVIPLAAAAAITGVSLAWLNRSIVKNLIEKIDIIVSSVSRMMTRTKETADTVREQFAIITEVTGTIREVDTIGDTTASDAQEVLSSSNDAVQRSSSGLTRIQDAIAVVDAVGEVGNLLDTIQILAEQSNLLAVNAGIEAAKAGDFGRGFTVVASEMRHLAKQSKKVTAQIQTNIKRTEEGRRAIETIHTVIRELADVLTIMTQKARQISSAVIQQSAGIGEILEAMKTVEESGENTSNTVVQLEQSIAALAEVNADLRRFVVGRQSGNSRSPTDV